MDLGLRDKTALVTGAASGIGQAIAVGLGSEGARVIVADRADARETLSQIPQGAPSAHSEMVDLSNKTDVDQLVRDVIDKYDGIDLFVNNAAVAVHSAIEELDEDTWRANIDTNLAACVWASAAIGKHMRIRRRGSMLIIGSTSVFTPRTTEAAYRVSKAGLKSFMEVLAIEMAPHGVRVNMLTPGSFNTGLTKGIPAELLTSVESSIPLRRSADPPELVATALLLLSDLASPYTTGANFIVDGGLHLRPID